MCARECRSRRSPSLSAPLPPPPRSDFSVPLRSPRLEARALRAAGGYLRHLLARAGVTALDEDEAALASLLLVSSSFTSAGASPSPAERHARTALVYRLTRKRLLEDAAAALALRAEQLDTAADPERGRRRALAGVDCGAPALPRPHAAASERTEAAAAARRALLLALAAAEGLPGSR
jgi:hypothetical protein